VVVLVIPLSFEIFSFPNFAGGGSGFALTYFLWPVISLFLCIPYYLLAKRYYEEVKKSAQRKVPAIFKQMIERNRNRRIICIEELDSYLEHGYMFPFLILLTAHLSLKGDFAYPELSEFSSCYLHCSWTAQGSTSLLGSRWIQNSVTWLHALKLLRPRNS